MVRAYILVEASVGRSMLVSRGVQGLDLIDSKVLSADTVTGPFDLIVRMESADLDRLGEAITAIQRVEGVHRTTTCLAIRLV